MATREPEGTTDRISASGTAEPEPNGPPSGVAHANGNGSGPGAPGNSRVEDENQQSRAPAPSTVEFPPDRMPHQVTTDDTGDRSDDPGSDPGEEGEVQPDGVIARDNAETADDSAEGEDRNGSDTSQPLSRPISLATNDPARSGAPMVLPYSFVRAAGHESPPSIMGNYLAPGQLAVSIGPAGVGKSLLLLTTAVCVASGIPLAGESPTQPRPVIVACAEDTVGETGRRIAAAVSAFGADPALVDRNLYVLDVGDSFSLATKPSSDNRIVPPEARELFRLAKRLGVGLVCFDPLIEFHDLNESDNGDMHFVAATLRTFARDAQCACLITHHTGKLESGRVTLLSARGASSLGGAVRAARAVSDLSNDDIRALGIDSVEARDIFKVEDLKMSYGPKRREPTYFQRVSVNVPGGTAPKLVMRVPSRRQPAE